MIINANQQNAMIAMAAMAMIIIITLMLQILVIASAAALTILAVLQQSAIMMSDVRSARTMMIATLLIWTSV